MGDRLSDDFMADLLKKHEAIENEYTPTCERVNYGSGCPGATDASIAFWRAAVDCIPAMATELKERRAADLTAEEREALTAAWYIINGAMVIDAATGARLTREHRLAGRALSALSKILKDGT
jgi:hypothetical protein